MLPHRLAKGVTSHECVNECVTHVQVSVTPRQEVQQPLRRAGDGYELACRFCRTLGV
jgi:hypothetical protein